MLDFKCWDDLDEFGSETDDKIEVLAQDLYHRLIEAPGSNLDDPDRGLGLEQMLSGTYDGSIASKIEAELRKDPWVLSVKCSVIQDADGSYRIDIEVEPDADEMGLTSAELLTIPLVADAQGVRRAA